MNFKYKKVWDTIAEEYYFTIAEKYYFDIYNKQILIYVLPYNLNFKYLKNSSIFILFLSYFKFFNNTISASNEKKKIMKLKIDK